MKENSCVGFLAKALIIKLVPQGMWQVTINLQSDHQGLPVCVSLYNYMSVFMWRQLWQGYRLTAGTDIRKLKKPWKLFFGGHHTSTLI